MNRLHLAAASACLLLSAASGAVAERAAAGQTLRLSVEVPSVLAMAAATAGEGALFALQVPSAGLPPASQARPGGLLRWATWASRREPRSVTAQLSCAPPSGIRIGVRLTPCEGQTTAKAREVNLGPGAIRVLADLTGGGLQEAAVGYQAEVAPGTQPTSANLTVIYTLCE